MPSDANSEFLLRAIDLARRGQGFVEPNPMVGCVIVREERLLAKAGISNLAGRTPKSKRLPRPASGQGATMYVTLEPCCHHGQDAALHRRDHCGRDSRVVVAMRDPFPQVAGGGLKATGGGGHRRRVGLHEAEAQRLNAPYLKLVTTGRPWIIAKWAMTLDGKIATRSGVQPMDIRRSLAGKSFTSLRGRVDAIMVGRKTAQLDDPLLTAAAGRRNRAAARGHPHRSRFDGRACQLQPTRSHGRAISHTDRHRSRSAGKRTPPPRRRRLRSVAVRAAQPLRTTDSTARRARSPADDECPRRRRRRACLARCSTPARSTKSTSSSPPSCSAAKKPARRSRGCG